MLQSCGICYVASRVALITLLLDGNKASGIWFHCSFDCSPCVSLDTGWERPACSVESRTLCHALASTALPKDRSGQLVEWRFRVLASIANFIRYKNVFILQSCGICYVASSCCLDYTSSRWKKNLAFGSTVASIALLVSPWIQDYSARLVLWNVEFLALTALLKDKSGRLVEWRFRDPIRLVMPSV